MRSQLLSKTRTDQQGSIRSAREREREMFAGSLALSLDELSASHMTHVILRLSHTTTLTD